MSGINDDHERVGNPVARKSFTFSLRIIPLCKSLQARSEFVMSRQLLKCGTSIGANVEEALGAFSKKEFAMKMAIAYKEARETDYWLRLLSASDLIAREDAISLRQDVQELLRILGTILKTLRGNLVKKS
jgi:four helix bundle protein